MERQWRSRELVPRSIPTVLQKILNWKLKLNFDFADVWSMLKNALLISKVKRNYPDLVSQPTHRGANQQSLLMPWPRGLRRWAATSVRLPILVYGTGPLVCHWHHVRHPEVDAISWALLSASKWHGLGAEPTAGLRDGQEIQDWTSPGIGERSPA